MVVATSRVMLTRLPAVSRSGTLCWRRELERLLAGGPDPAELPTRRLLDGRNHELAHGLDDQRRPAIVPGGAQHIQLIGAVGDAGGFRGNGHIHIGPQIDDLAEAVLIAALDVGRRSGKGRPAKRCVFLFPLDIILGVILLRSARRCRRPGKVVLDGTIAGHRAAACWSDRPSAARR